MPAHEVAPPVALPAQLARWRLQIWGVVQGVGFRPFVYREADTLGLAGWVRNSSAGVELELQGAEPALQTFLKRLRQAAPPLAHILDIQVTAQPPQADQPAGLTIIPSRAGASGERTLISPDVATCAACRAEVEQPDARRHAYPFTNCTHCGPRFTIITDLPYDRPLTTMAGFRLCPACAAEYRDPADRRFHAQPIACSACGPHLTFSDGVMILEGATALDETVRRLEQGQIIAIKGLGGVHLACRADQIETLNRLRQAKARPHKPLALMAADLAMAGRLGSVSPSEAALLSAPAAPIVLLRRRADCSEATLDGVSPQNGYVGVMLPYTPLHQLLMARLKRPLVLTSGNAPGEPLVIDNAAARRQLASLVDGWLLHDRPIQRRCDDSVAFIAHLPDQPRFQAVRRSRGYAPLPILLPPALTLGAPGLATGGDLKNVAALGVERLVFLTQHIGDLRHPETRAELGRTVTDFERLFRIRPQFIACDSHPDYAARRLATERASAEGLPLIEVQHHHAHIAACAAENDVITPVIGLGFDGAGYGPDGRIWGGEGLLVDLRDFERVYHLEYLPLPGGDAAVRRPYRLAAAYLLRLLPEVDPGAYLPDIPSAEIQTVAAMLRADLNTPLTSSMGRLFDAVSALLGLTRIATHEAQAAIALEAAALHSQAEGRYTLPLEGDCIRIGPLLAEITADLQRGAPIPDIARRFHLSVAGLAVDLANAIQATAAGGRLHSRFGPPAGCWPVALSGGVWQNRLLLELSVPRLQAAGFQVLLHKQTPANDGGLAYGQMAVAAARLADAP